MGIFDSIKSAFSGKEETDSDVTVAPSALLREAGLDPSGLKFGFGNRSITVSGEISREDDRQKILDILTALPGIDTVQDAMEVSAPAADEPVDSPSSEDVSPQPEEPEAGKEPETRSAESGERTYTVKSGDTLWKISEAMYGDGSKYMNIFEANTGTLEHPDRIFPGQELVIPETED